MQMQYCFLKTFKMKWGLNLSWVPGSSIQLNSSSDCEGFKKSVSAHSGSSFTGSPIYSSCLNALVTLPE